MKKNETYVLTIENFGCNGEGIARKDNFPIFIEGAIPGEEAEILIVKVLKNFAYGKILRILKPSKDRTEPVCPVFKRCGGCQLLHLNYETQLAFKTDYVKDCLRKFSGLQNFEVAPCCGMEGEPFYYRNKAQYPVSSGKCGFYAPRSHTLIPIESCIVQSKADAALIKIIENYPYNSEIRHLYTRTGESEIMAVLVTKSKKLPEKEQLISQMKAAGVATLVQNINPKNTNVILGSENIVLYGKGFVEGKIGNLAFSISPHSFFQINTRQTERLYAKGKELLNLSGGETVLDMYCGIGSIGLFMADRAKKIIGVECVPQAVLNARENAEKNHIQNAEFIEGLSEDVLPELIKKGIRPDAVVIDPPRKGCDEKLLSALLTCAPDKILYISCNPATFARDIKILSETYALGTVYPFDLFPQTRHVETVVLLQRQNT